MEQSQLDHDLLIEIKTKLNGVIEQIKELKDNVSVRVDTLEKGKLDIEESNRLLNEANSLHEDHERRIRKLERWGMIAIGFIAAVEIFLKFIVK